MDVPVFGRQGTAFLAAAWWIGDRVRVVESVVTTDQMTSEEFQPYIQQKYAAVFAGAFALPSQINRILDVPVGEPLQKIVRFMAKIVANDFGGLTILSLYGYGVPGAKIARAMFEASVNAAYLAKHAECVDDYIDFHVVANRKFFRHLLRYDPGAAKAIGDEKILAMEAEYSRVAHRFRNSRGSWTSASIADRAEDVGSGDLYRLAYGTLSSITHGDIVGMQAHATPEGIDVEPGPSEQWIHESLAVGHAAVANVFRTFIEVASLNMDASIAAIHAGYLAAWPSPTSDTAGQVFDA